MNAVRDREGRRVIILHMPRRTPRLYLWAACMRLRNRIERERKIA